MDFYAVKFMATSNLTGETYIGYLFGKKAQSPYFNVLLLNKSQMKEIDLPDISKDYLEFKSDIDLLYYQLSRKKENDSLQQFRAYFYSTLRKMNFEIIGTKIFLAIEENDTYVLKSILADILKEWAGETNIKLIAQKFDYKDLTWVSAVKEKGEKGFEEYFNRQDVKDAIEVYPIIDPVEGYPIFKLDIGEPIIVLLVDNTEKAKKPKSIIEGRIISKELIPSSDYIFLKIDLGNNNIGKTIVHNDLKVSIDQSKLQLLRQSQEKLEDDENEKIIGDIYEQMKNNKNSYEYRKIGSLDFLLISGFSVIAILLIILIAIILGAV
ncbi:DUF4899 domain-containing protein [Petrotoga sp. 9PWA.NaAc.5.4]|uniref:DUF4899 domain-containing protein n=1 Tax=Petrotoga sp. 9PWA.NaAc.5.4 TaxID=1434328 RepID=UPI000CAC761D|nr:DUF4899 domain-containing protein [Petrotoga sp. 9PWA.NaAc.5.4]PNR92546.1 hypothetical protein X924_09150 [Petrotoga sp. 9PWA.NaAc.5.4]